MPIVSFFFALGFQHAYNKLVDWDTDTIKAMLTEDSYLADETSKDTHDFLNDVSANRATGQTQADDQTVPTRVFTITAAADTFDLDCGASVTYTAVGAGAGILTGVIVYVDTAGAETTDNLLMWLEFTAGVTANGSDITVNFNAAGCGQITY